MGGAWTTIHASVHGLLCAGGEKCVLDVYVREAIVVIAFCSMTLGRDLQMLLLVKRLLSM